MALLFSEATEDKPPEDKEKQHGQHPGQQITQPSVLDYPGKFHLRLTKAIGQLRIDPGRDEEFSAVWQRLFQLAFKRVLTNIHLFDLLVFQELLKLTVEKSFDWTFSQPVVLKKHDGE